MELVENVLSTRPFIRIGAAVWARLPPQAKHTKPGEAFGVLLQQMIRRRSPREQNPRTYFLRNRPELELVCKLAGEKPQGATYKVAVLACSMGAEAYSLLYELKKARPDLKIEMNALDILPEVIDVARSGVWKRDAYQLERLTPEEREAFFDQVDPQTLRVKQWLRDGVKFDVANAIHPDVLRALGPQDLVVANRFLCHMQPVMAESALREIARAVAPGGYLVCSGVDVDVRTKVMRALGYIPVTSMLEALHDGDHTLRDGWPIEYWALEPLDKSRPDWEMRYASVFQRPEAS